MSPQRKQERMDNILTVLGAMTTGDYSPPVPILQSFLKSLHGLLGEHDWEGLTEQVPHMHRAVERRRQQGESLRCRLEHLVIRVAEGVDILPDVKEWLSDYQWYRAAHHKLYHECYMVTDGGEG